MKRLVLILLFFPFLAHGQQITSKWWVQFTDRSNTPYSLTSPSDYLSSRAIERRQRQAILVDSTDIPVNPHYIDSIAHLGVPVLNRSKWFNAVTIQTDRTDLLKRIGNMPFVRRMEPVTIYNVKAEPPLDTSSAKTLNYGWGWDQIDMLNGRFLHEQGYTGSGIQIAVLDNGFSAADLMVAESGTNLLGGWDFVEQDGTFYEKGTHGTLVLSTMAAQLSDLTGTAPNAAYWLIRTEDPFNEQRIEEDNWVAGAEFADSAGADVINSSLGYSVFAHASMNYTYAELDGNTTRVTQGADMAARKGMLVVNSAGNSGNDPWEKIIAPADGDSVLAVGAVDVLGNYAGFSSRGPSADGRVKPDVAAMGSNTWVHYPGVGTFQGSGTSFAAPIVAGMSACLWQAFPNATNMDIMNAIRESASQYSNPDERLGYGIPDFAMAYMLLAGADGSSLQQAEPILFPRPSGGDVEILMYSDVPYEAELNIYDTQGRLVKQGTLYVRGGRHTREVVLAHAQYPPGVYLVQVVGRQGIFTLKAVILN